MENKKIMDFKVFIQLRLVFVCEGDRNFNSLYGVQDLIANAIRRLSSVQQLEIKNIIRPMNKIRLKCSKKKIMAMASFQK